MKLVNNKQSDILIFICLIVAGVATAGSLFFSQVMEFPPCVLCWYQRIAMYPLILIFAAGLFSKNREVFLFSFPLAFSGWFIALYHNLLHYEIVPETASPCLEGVSCSTVYINWFGFITIPMLSFIAFSIIMVMLLKLRKNYEK